MKENMKDYKKRKGFYVLLAASLAAVLCISGIAGYRSGKKEQRLAANETVTGASETKEIEAKEAQATVDTAPETKESKSFDEKTKMEWPVRGEIMKAFSPDQTIYFETLDQYKCNPALLIKADLNDEVYCAFDGRVTEMKQDAENGLMVTVDMGNGYQAVYGQLKDVSLKSGDLVSQGQTIGKIAAQTKYFTKEGPHLYFALNKNDQTLNPMDYLSEIGTQQ